jgi:hypothetical protein
MAFFFLCQPAQTCLGKGRHKKKKVQSTFLCRNLLSDTPQGITERMRGNPNQTPAGVRGVLFCFVVIHRVLRDHERLKGASNPKQ